MTRLCIVSPTEKTPGGLTIACKTLHDLLPCVPFSRADVVVAVGWHTDSERALSRASSEQIKIFWSHGVGTFVFFRAKPIRSILRTLLRSCEIIKILFSLSRCNCLVVAYKRSNWNDVRSIDEVLARLLKTKIEVIGNPIDTDFWFPMPSTFQFSQVLSVGRLEWQKGHETARHIVRLSSVPLCLTILAAEANDDTRKVLSMTSPCSEGGAVDIKIGLSPEARRAALQHSLCLISWSETEYQSLAMLEALACGCPVIARPRGWLCHASIPGVLVVRTPQEAACCLQQLFEDQTWRHHLGKLGRRYVVREHSLPEVRAKWANMCQSLQ